MAHDRTAVLQDLIRLRWPRLQVVATHGRVGIATTFTSSAPFTFISPTNRFTESSMVWATHALPGDVRVVAGLKLSVVEALSVAMLMHLLRSRPALSMRWASLAAMLFSRMRFGEGGSTPGRGRAAVN